MSSLRGVTLAGLAKKYPKNGGVRKANYPCRDELATADNLIYKAQNIPPNLRENTLHKLHQSQRRVEALPSMHCNSLIFTIMIFHNVSWKSCGYLFRYFATKSSYF